MPHDIEIDFSPAGIGRVLWGRCTHTFNGGALSVVGDCNHRCGGETISGFVNIDPAWMEVDNVEYVQIVLTGTYDMYVSHLSSSVFALSEMSVLPRSSVHRQLKSGTLLNKQLILWRKDSAPTPSSKIVKLPFHFDLPKILPPTFGMKDRKSNYCASYALQLVGFRRGILVLSRRGIVLLSIVAPTSSEDVEKRFSVLTDSPSDIPWATRRNSKDVRSARWGPHGQVEIEVNRSRMRIRPKLGDTEFIQVMLPDLPNYPAGVPIPYKIHVKTTTKPLKPSNIPADVQALFPAPPTVLNAMELSLEHDITLTVEGKTWKQEKPSETVKYSAAIIKDGVEKPVSTRIEDPVWQPLLGGPKSGQKSVCIRSAHFESKMTFLAVPSFEYTINSSSVSNQVGNARLLLNHFELQLIILMDDSTNCLYVFPCRPPTTP
jgi:hypothetical protein